MGGKDATFSGELASLYCDRIIALPQEKVVGVQPEATKSNMKILEIKVKPNARVAKIEQTSDGSWVAHVTAPPIDGKANSMLIAMLAQHFGVRKQDVSIKSGASSRRKRIEIDE